MSGLSGNSFTQNIYLTVEQLESEIDGKNKGKCDEVVLMPGSYDSDRGFWTIIWISERTDCHTPMGPKHVSCLLEFGHEIFS